MGDALQTINAISRYTSLLRELPLTVPNPFIAGTLRDDRA